MKETSPKTRQDTTPKNTEETEGLFISNLGFVSNSVLDRIPKQLGQYKLTELIGRGGMGMVYKAHQASTDRMVAVKVICPSSLIGLSECEQQDIQKRFLSEAKNAASIQHENVVQVYEAGSEHGVSFLAMQLVDGFSLANKLNDKQILSDQEAARMFVCVASGLAAVHEQRMVHRDITPANIFVDEAENVFIGDFGLAKNLESTTASTAINSRIGTLPYLSPEQTRGASATTQLSDVYGLGATMYHALCGSPPFVASSEADLIRQIDRVDAEFPEKLLGTLSQDLCAVCLKCLEKNPDDRYESAIALRDDLKRFLDGLPTEARPLNRTARLKKWARRNPEIAKLVVAATGLLVTLLALASFGWYYTSGLNAELSTANRDLDKSLQQEKIAKQEADDNLQQANKNLKKAIDAIRQSHLFVANAPHLLPSVPGNEYLRVNLNNKAIELLLTVRDQGFSGEVNEILIKAFHSLGISYQAVGMHDDAIIAFRRSLSEAEQYPDAIRGFVQTRLIAWNHIDLSNSYRAIGKSDEAQTSVEKAMDRYRQTENDTDYWLESQIGIASGFNQLAGLADELDEKLRHFEAAVSVYDSLKEIPQFSSDFDYKREFGTVLYNFAITHQHSGYPNVSVSDFSRARELIDRSIEIRSQLVADFPKRLIAKYHLAGSKKVLGELMRNVGQENEGRRESLEALEMLKKLAAESPAVPKYSMEFVLMNMQLQSGKKPEVREKHLLAASTQIDTLNESTGNRNFDSLIRSARVHSDFGYFLVEQKRVEESDSHYLAAEQILLDLLELNPSNEPTLEVLGSLILNRGQAWMTIGEKNKGIQQLELVESLDMRLPDESRRAETWLEQKSAIYETLFQLHKEAGSDVAAKVALKRAIQFSVDDDEKIRLRGVLQKIDE